MEEVEGLVVAAYLAAVGELNQKASEEVVGCLREM